MTDPIQELLVDYALGTASEADRARVDAELARSPELRAALQETEALFAAPGLALEPVAPPPQLRERLMAEISQGAERFSPFSSALQRMFDLGREAMDAVMTRAEKISEWELAPFDGGQLFHFNGGPALAGADCGLVRFPAGFEHPYHTHLGEEVMLILQGQHIDDEGAVRGPGSVIVMPSGSGHAYRCGPDAEFVAAVSVREGIDVYPSWPNVEPVIPLRADDHD